MEMGQQLRRSVNVDHEWIVSKTFQGCQSKEELDRNLDVRLTGLIVVAERHPRSHLTVAPASAPPQMCSEEPPCDSLICQAGCHGNW